MSRAGVEAVGAVGSPYDGANFLYRNDGTGRLEPITAGSLPGKSATGSTELVAPPPLPGARFYRVTVVSQP